LFSRYAAEIPIVRPFVHSFYSSFVHSPYSSFVQIIFVQPLCCRNSDRPFVRSFIVTIHHSFIRTIHHSYSLLLFIIVTIHRRCYSRRYSSLVLFIVVIHRCYYSSMISIVTFSSLLFIDHPITLNFNYSSIMLSRSPKTSQTNIPVIRIPVIRTPMTVIFLPVRTFYLVTHPRFSPS
jgi:uncharacterized membrane protein YesL